MPSDDDIFLTVQRRGTMALPPSLRRDLGLDKPGAQVRVVVRSDGVIELHPVVPVPADQSWFWSKRWQSMEKSADEDVTSGRVTVTDGPEAFLAELDG